MKCITDYSTSIAVARREVHDESIELASHELQLSADEVLQVPAKVQDKIEVLHVEAEIQSKAGAKALGTLLSMTEELCIGTENHALELPQPCRLAESNKLR